MPSYQESGYHDSRYYEQLRVMDDMNDSRLRAKGSKHYEHLRIVVHTNDSRS